MSDLRFIAVFLLSYMEVIRRGNGFDYMTGPQEAPCTSPSGKAFSVAFIDDLSGDQGDLQLHIANPGDTKAKVDIKTPYIPDTFSEFVGIKATIAPLKTSVFYLPKSLQVLATGFETKIVTVNSDVTVRVLAVQNGTSRPSSFIVYPWNAATMHTAIVTGDVDGNSPERAVVVIIPKATGKRRFRIGLSNTAAIEWRDKVYRGPKANYAGDLPFNGESLFLEVSGGKFIVLNSNTDLSGSFVYSKHEFIVFSGNTGSGSSSDLYPHRVQQILPDAGSGFYFMTPSFPNPSKESVFKIILSLPDTSVTVTTSHGTDVHDTAGLQPPFFHIVNPANSILRINSTRRIKLFQRQMDVGDSSSMVMLRAVPALEHLTSDISFSIPFEGNNKITVHAIKESFDKVMLDGDAIFEDQWTRMDDQYINMWYAEVGVAAGVHRLQSDTGNALLSVQSFFSANRMSTVIDTGHFICANVYNWRGPKKNHSYYIRVTSKGLPLPEHVREQALEVINGPLVMCLQRCMDKVLCGAVLDLGIESEGKMSCHLVTANRIYYGTDFPVYARYRL